MALKNINVVMKFVLAICGAAFIGLSYFLLPEHVKTTFLTKMKTAYLNDNRNHHEFAANLTAKTAKEIFLDEDLIRQFPLKPNGSDAIVYVRIQKTGSSEMVNNLDNLDLSRWCDCPQVQIKKSRDKCRCYQQALRSMFYHVHGGGPHHKHSWVCAFHADWTYLRSCATMVLKRELKRKVIPRMITVVRHPLRRFISEYLHTKKGHTTWHAAPLICNGKSATKKEVQLCSKTFHWYDVTLKSFISCKSNLAINRQTRMLADLTLVNCYNTSGMSYEARHMKMLESAKQNLKNMAYFGITEYQELSEALFTRTFNISFLRGFKTKKLTKGSLFNLTDKEKKDILSVNRFDVMLYRFAKDLFIQRLQKVGVIPNVT